MKFFTICAGLVCLLATTVPTIKSRPLVDDEGCYSSMTQVSSASSTEMCDHRYLRGSYGGERNCVDRGTSRNLSDSGDSSDDKTQPRKGKKDERDSSDSIDSSDSSDSSDDRKHRKGKKDSSDDSGSSDSSDDKKSGKGKKGRDKKKTRKGRRGNCKANFIAKGESSKCFGGKHGVLSNLSCRTNRVGVCSEVDCCEEIEFGLSYDFDM